MATITTAGSGNSNSTTPNAPWPGGTLPTSADKVVIAAGHVVTVPAGATFEVGDPAVFAADVLTIQGSSASAALIIAGQLTLHGGVQQGDRPVQVQRDSVIEFDFGSHLTAIVWTMGQAHQDSNSKLLGSTDATAPTSARPVIIRGAAGQSNKGHCFTSNSHQQCGQWDVQAVKLLRMGSATVPVHRTNNPFSGNTFRLGWCIADSCGELVIEDGGLSTGGIFSISNTTIRNSVTAAGAYGIELVGDGPAAAITGARLFSRLRSDRTIKCWLGQMTLSDVVVDCGATNIYGIDLVNAGTSLASADKIVTRTGGTGTRMVLHPGDALSNAYMVNQGAANPRWWAMASDGDGSPKTTAVTSCIVQRAGGDAQGDPFIQSTDPATVQTYQFRRCLWLHNALNRAQQTSKIVSPLGNPSHQRYNIEKCTWMTYVTSVESGIPLGESQTGDVGTVAFQSIRDNIAWAPGTALTDRWIFNQFNGGFVQATPPLVAAQVDYNGKFNLSSDGVNPAGYHSPTPASLVASGTLGQHDVTGDPKFLDSRLRDMGLWHAVHVGASITGNEQAMLDAAFAAMMLANDVDGSYDSYYEIAGVSSALIPWVTAGYAPTSLSYRGADHLGTGEPGAAAGVFGKGRQGLSLSLRMGLS